MKKGFMACREYFDDMKLQKKLTLLLVLVAIVPAIVLGVLFFGRLYEMFISDSIRKEQVQTAGMAPVIQQELREILEAGEMVEEQGFYRKMLQSWIEEPFSELTRSREAFDFRKKTEEIVEQTALTGIRIYVDFPNNASDLFQSTATKNLFLPMSQVTGTYWHGIFNGTQAKELFCPPFYLGVMEKNTLGDLAYIKTETIHYYGNDYQAYLALYFSQEPFEKLLFGRQMPDGSVTYITNERDALVVSTDVRLSGLYWLSYEEIRDSVLSSNSFIEREILDEKVYAGYYRIDPSGWFLVTIMPYKTLVLQSRLLLLKYTLIYLGFLAIAFLLAIRLSHTITARLSKVIYQMQQVKEGPPVPLEIPRRLDEIGDLADTYNYLTAKMKQLMETQKKAAEDLRLAEFNSLQAQINPHFLYNTMDMINWLARQGRMEEISDAVQNLSRFYKLTLSRKQSVTTIAAEEEHVSIYVALQNMRFHDSICFVSDIPDELLHYSIPKLTLQPIIENAILHGILEKESKKGTIVLTGWREGTDVVLMISDDGVGIPAGLCESILSGKENEASKGTNIAVYNTHRRLQILYGKDYGLSYTSRLGEGTEVEIRIPVLKKE